MNTKVLCYGGIGFDNIIHVPYMPTPGVATTPTRQQFQLGGGAALTAIWLAHWQIPVALSGNMIGNDERARHILSWLNQYPTFNSDFLQQSNEVETPYTLALIPPDGDRYLIEIGYDKALMTDAASINLDHIEIATVNFYYNNPEKETRRFARIAYENNIKVIASDVIDENNPLFPVSSMLINSRAVMEKMLPEIDHHQYCIELQAKHGGIVIMTDGNRPVRVVDRHGKTFSIEIPQVDVHDATGAGDAFRAGVIYGELQGWELQDSVKLGVATGALQVKRDASVEAPTPFEDIQKLARTLVIRA